MDVFGTEPEFNDPNYARLKGKVTGWGMWDLVPKQFNTMFREYFIRVTLYITVFILRLLMV